MTPDPNHATFKMTFRIEQLPDGTFVARSDNPKLEIKGATPQEVQQKIQHSMGSRIVERLGIHMAVAVTGEGIEVSGTKDAPAPDTAPGLPTPAGSAAPSFAAPVFRTSDAEISGTAPITPGPIDAGSLRAQRLLAALLVLAAALLAYWFWLR
ncbi:MAG: hypothetical protein HYX28_09420 [Candidatus Koribacter versatilis]|uniref:Uncharacterized protein n=1 Tax=Candidatus Korobacter versatilis TaxID=658062 RepID=A0A932EQ58_9BACT|nr:hypothetical protein [Candidatus Koribacter versatilis]